MSPAEVVLKLEVEDKLGRDSDWIMVERFQWGCCLSIYEKGSTVRRRSVYLKADEAEKIAAALRGGFVSPATRPMLHYCVGDIDGYAIMVHDDPDGRVRWAASLRALPGCIAQGDSKQEALTKLRAIWPPYRAFLERHGCTIPDPDPPSLTIGDAWGSA